MWSQSRLARYTSLAIASLRCLIAFALRRGVPPVSVSNQCAVDRPSSNSITHCLPRFGRPSSLYLWLCRRADVTRRRSSFFTSCRDGSKRLLLSAQSRKSLGPPYYAAPVILSTRSIAVLFVHRRLPSNHPYKETGYGLFQPSVKSHTVT